MKKEFVAQAGLTITSFLVGLLLLEAALRLGRAPAFSLVPPTGYFQPQPERGYDITPSWPATRQHAADGSTYRLWSNELGCFDRPADRQELARGYVLLVGDSFTFGYMPWERTWGSQMQNRLGLRILQCGVPGYGTKQEFSKAKGTVRRLGRLPRAVVVGYFENDMEDDYLFPRSQVVDGFLASARAWKDMRTGAVAVKSDAELKAKARQYERGEEAYECPGDSRLQLCKCFLYRHSLLYRRVKDPLKNWLSRLPFFPRKDLLAAPEPFAFWLPRARYPRLDEAWRRHLANIAAFADYFKSRGVPILFVMIPMKEQVYPHLCPPANADSDPDQPQRIVSAFGRVRGIDVYDLLPIFREHADAGKTRLDPRTDLYWDKDLHWSPNGTELAGRAVADVLRRRLSAPGTR
jgi:hypothetical protein